jgi:hypothetical protein
MYDVRITSLLATLPKSKQVRDSRFEYVFIGACYKAANQAHLAERRAAIAIQDRFFDSQHGEQGLLGLVAITAILTGPAGPAKHLLKLIRHGVSTLASEMRRTLGTREILITHTTKIKVGSGGRRVLNLTLERIEPISQFLDITGIDGQHRNYGRYFHVRMAGGIGLILPFAGSALHRLPTELATRSCPLATRASFRSIFARRVTPNLPYISIARHAPQSLCAPFCAGIHRTLATPLTACDSDHWDRTRRVVLPSSLLHAPSAAESA